MNWQLVLIVVGLLLFFLVLYMYNNREDESPIYDELPFIPVLNIVGVNRGEKAGNKAKGVKEGGSDRAEGVKEGVENSPDGNPKIHHSIIPDSLTRKLIPPPYPIQSPMMTRGIQEIADNPVCLQTEEKLVEDGKKIVNDLSNNISPVFPDVFTKYKDSRPTCDLLLQAWSRYFFGLQQLYNFTSAGKLPPVPTPSKENCQGFVNVENIQRKNANLLREYTMCLVKNKGNCKEPKQQPIDFDPSCPACERTFSKWAMYMYSLRTICRYISN